MRRTSPPNKAELWLNAVSSPMVSTEERPNVELENPDKYMAPANHAGVHRPGNPKKAVGRNTTP